MNIDNTSTQLQANIKHSTNFLRLRRRMHRQVGNAITDYSMIADGDVVLVCISGGKDSYTMLHILRNLQKRAPVNFDIIAMNLDQSQPDFPSHILPAYFQNIGVRYHIEKEDTYSIVQKIIPAGKTTCSLCSRLRRGIIYRVAKKLKANKIALGHHMDDIVETLFLNMFFGSKLKAMPPKLVTDDSHHIVVRPLAYCREKDVARYARAMDFPLIPCNLCGSQDNLQRHQIKKMIHDWEKSYPGRTNNLFRALQNITPSHLADQNLYDFQGLKEKPNAIVEHPITNDLLKYS